ncbi:N-acetylmuramoyl-L-alanine amidase [Aminobacter sp. HY435]|uniref:N-acetylmuramoyl-L-alanine amidase n=1 Tax=Aminobacter sp. HY435 TaxID=2970917 RepID=UPI0022B97934|nr:N-acetylmuramoyl-L-alanine amidase [Aminobacter sp. HY435]
MLTFRPREATTKVVLHDSQTPPSQTNLKHFLAVKGRAQGLLAVGYHYLILRDGRLLECRPHNAWGAHMRHRNADSIAVCLGGGVDEAGEPEGNFTPEQGETLRGLMAYLADFYGPLPLVGHSEAYPRHSRQCPAINMEKARAWVTNPN